MKILYLTDGGECYQSVCLFHGLRDLLGEEVVDFPRLKPAYAGERAGYGGGFTVYSRSPEIAVDRSDIESKLAGGYFDAVIWAGWPVYFGEKLSLDHIPLPQRTKPVIVDGGDYRENSRFASRGVYFKREWVDRGHPIGFAVPADIVVDEVPPKSRLWALYEPYMPHIYTVESDYYSGYGNSRLAVTHRKAGWDCIRHYEIMSQGCVPFFVGLDSLPAGNLTTLPLDLLREVLYKFWDFYQSRPTRTIHTSHWTFDTVVRDLGTPRHRSAGKVEELTTYADQMLEHVRKHNTTRVLASNFLSVLARS